jgi:hypothetical protein
VPVRIQPNAYAAFAIRSADDAVLLGFLDIELDDDARARLSQKRVKTLRRYRGDALLVGNLAEGSWPTLVIDDQVLRPVSPFRTPRRLPWRTEAGLPAKVKVSRPVDPARDVPTLPWDVPLRAESGWSLPVLIAVLVVAPFTVGAFAVWGQWFAALMATAIGAQLVHSLATRVLFRVTATATDLWIRTGWFARRLSWRAVEAVEVEENGLSLRADNDWHVVGGIADQERTKVAAVFETLRLRSHTGLPEEPVTRRPSPVLLIDAVYVGVCALILLTRWNPF